MTRPYLERREDGEEEEDWMEEVGASALYTQGNCSRGVAEDPKLSVNNRNSPNIQGRVVVSNGFGVVG